MSIIYKGGNIMEELLTNKKTKIVIIVVCVLLAVIAAIVIATSNGEDENEGASGNQINNNVIPNGGTAQDVNKEKLIEGNEATEIFHKLPLIYTEEYAPFSDVFMLEAAMSIVIKEEEPNYSAAHVDELVKTLFGDDAKINKDNVKDMNIQKSLYYYYPDVDTYYIIPVGTEFQYKNQLLNKVTRDDNYTYVYSNEINGTWHFEEEEAVIVIGDKAGNDLVKRFSNYEEMQAYSAWQEDYKDKLPVLKYSLKKLQDRYIIVGVEKVNY